MVLGLMLKGLKRGRVRFACAAAGVAVSVGVVVFMFSLTATNSAQAPALAKRASAPWAAWSFSGGPGGMGGPGGLGAMGRGERPQRPDAAGRPPEGRGRPEGGRPGMRPGGQRPGEGGPDRPKPDGLRPAGPKGDLSLPLVSMTIDYRPGGRVLQGPPMRAVLAEAPGENPYGATRLVEGRWVEAAAASNEIVCTKNAMRRFRRGEAPPVGTDVKFVGRVGTMTARIVGYLEEAKLPPGWPTVFANGHAFAELSGEAHGAVDFWRETPKAWADGARPDSVLTPDSETVAVSFKSDEARRMDYARPLLLAASVLVALCLLVNTLLLSIEANRVALAMLRTVGLTRGGVVRLVLSESLAATFAGFALGGLVSLGALAAYVAADGVAFPMGMAVSWRALGLSAVFALAVSVVAALFALRPALAVRPLDALAERRGKRRRGMAVVFALGFAAFVAVEVWGASLMRAFVPSAEWPDAIVSILPAGVSSFDMEKLDGLEGVERISELYPLQVNYHPEEPMPMPRAARADSGRGGPGGPGGPGGRMMRRPCRNALFLAAEWLPEFRFVEGTHDEAAEALFSSNAVVITEMMSRAKNLHVGDALGLAVGGGRGEPAQRVELPIAGVVDLNWHMVTSRGLVRGMNGMPGMTDGPVFASFDTVESLDPRPAMNVRMTHLWVDYKPDFLAKHGVFPAGRIVEREIAAALGNPIDSTVRLHARDEIADGTLAHGDDIIGQAARVPFVFLFVLSIGFIAMLVADADAAKREFAVLRAVGATRAQLAWRLALRALRTAAWGTLFGLPLGALVGWLFAGKTGAVWPGLPHYFVVPWRIVSEGAAASLAFVLVVAVATSSYLVARAIRGGLGR